MSNSRASNAERTVKKPKVLNSPPANGTNGRPGRTVLIIREIPLDTQEAQVRDIFSIDGWDCPPIKDLKSDIGNNWFVQFENEEDCLRAAMKIQNDGVFNGGAVKCRVKSNLKTPKQGRQSSPVQYNAYGVPSYGYQYPRGNRGRGRGRGQRGKSPRRGRGRGRGYAQHTRGRPRAPYNPGPHMEIQQVSSDYPGEFTRFSLEKMTDIIENTFKHQPAPKPDSMKDPGLAEIVREKPQTHVLFKEAANLTMNILPRSPMQRRQRRGSEPDNLELNNKKRGKKSNSRRSKREAQKSAGMYKNYNFASHN